MNRIFTVLIIFFIFCANTVCAFNIEKARVDYRGADFKVSAVKETLHENAPAISISFTVPLSKKLLKNHHVELSGGEYDYWIISKDQTKITFPFVSPDTRYTITVSDDIRDINGQRLRDPYVKRIKTKRITPTVGFTSSGHILSSSSPKKLTVTTLNIDKIDVDFFSIRRDKISQFLNSLRRNGRFSYYQLNNLKRYGKHVYKGRFNLNPRKNQRTEYNIDLSSIRQLRRPGLYAAVINKVGTYEYNYEFAYFMQTNIGLHVRKYSDHMDVYAQDIATGRSLRNVNIKVLNHKGQITGRSVISNLYGYTSFPSRKRQEYIVAEKGDQFSILKLRGNALDLSGLKNAVSNHSEYQIYPFGPRDLYRPSEKIKVNVLVRDYDGRIPLLLPISYTLFKPDGSRLRSGQIQPESRGFYQFSYNTTSSSQTGRYHLKFKFGSRITSSYFFKLEEFLPERLDLKLFDGKYDSKRVERTKRQILVPVSSKYLYGAPASGNKVDGSVYASVDPHPFEKLKTYHFGDPDERIRMRRRSFREIKLSASGNGVLKMDNKWSDIKSPVRFNINASVYETGGRPVTRKSTLTMINGRHLIGIEPQFDKRPDSNSTVKIRIGCVNADGNWIRNRKVQVTLIRKDRNWYWKYSHGRGWHWDYNESPVVVFSKNVYVDKHKLVNLPLTWGSYKVVVKDNTTVSSYSFQTSWSWWANSSDKSMQKPDQISLGFEKNSYKPGDTLKLKINPPESGLALITVENSDGALYRVFKRVRSKGTEIYLRTQRSWDRHDLYVSVMVIKPGDMEKTPVPTRSFGMIHIPLKRDNTELKVDISAPEKIEPNRKITAKIKIGSKRRLPGNTKVIVALVDVGILNITRFKTPDAEAYFFAPRRYNIDLYDNYGQVIDNLGPKNARHMFGGGFKESDAQLARGGDKPKSEVMMVSFLSDPVNVNRRGEAEVSFNLPNFNGKLRWMVLAYSDESFGKGDKETKVADKIVTQISMPRFLASKDKADIALDINNMSGSDQSLKIKFSTKGSLRGQSVTKNIILRNDGKKVLTFPVEALEKTGQGIIHLDVRNSDRSIKLEREWKIGVRYAYPGVTRKVFSVINPGESWKPDLRTDDLLPESVKFQMTLSNRPPINFADHFNYLLHYPYGCLEQSTSSGYPWVLASSESLNMLGLTNIVQKRFKRDYTDQFRKEQIDKAISLVLNKLKKNGSFGLWSSGSPENEWLTVYAAEFLNDAKKAGGSVSYNTLRKINNRLRKYLQGNFLKRYRWTQDGNHYEFAFRSYAGYVLAKENLVSISQLRRLSSQFMNKTNDDGLSWMYLAASFKIAGDYYNSDKCYNKALKERVREKYKYYGEYGSNLRDLARITELALNHKFPNSRSLMFDLSTAIRERRWMSTQERIALFRTAVINERGTDSGWSAVFEMKGRNQRISKERAFNSIFDINSYRNLRSVRAGNNTLYASVTLVGTSENPPGKKVNELSITRTFYNTKGNLIKMDQMKSGELAIVKLEISAKKRTPDGLVVDLIPAGLEIENQNLGLASTSIGDFTIDGKKIKNLRRGNILHEEFRDDRYVAAIEVNTHRPVTLFYLVRAVTPGLYCIPNSYVEDMYRPYRFGIGETTKNLRIFK